MAPRFDGPLVGPVGSAAAPLPAAALGDPRQQAFQRALQGLLGTRVAGQVLARLADGSALVNVAGTNARMALPAAAQVGAEVPLTLVALTPRPTFEVGGPGGALAEAEPHAALLAQAPLTPARLLQQAGRDDAGAASLSPTARLLGSVLAAALRAGQPGATVLGRLPLLGAPTADGGALAAALQDGVAKSGLFYESHVAEWAQGQRTLAELAAEPQMAGPRPGAPGADPATAQLINLQLTAHEQDRLAWQGQLWPGQPLHLEVRREGRDGPGRDGGAGAGEHSWQSRLRLRFGALGELAASVVLAGDQLHIQLDAGSAATGALLRAHGAGLAEALAAAGTPLATLAVNDPARNE